MKDLKGWALVIAQMLLLALLILGPSGPTVLDGSILTTLGTAAVLAG